MKKRAAMEMTMGTMVTIVLLVMVLILGGYFVNRIFFSATKSIDSISDAMENEINNLFAEDDTRKIIIYPRTREISLEKGQQGRGFAFSIRNVDIEESTISYTINAVETSCPNALSLAKADSYISISKTGSIPLSAGSIMEYPEIVKFNIPEVAPPCIIKYSISMQKDGSIYGQAVSVLVNIESD